VCKAYVCTVRKKTILNVTSHIIVGGYLVIKKLNIEIIYVILNKFNPRSKVVHPIRKINKAFLIQAVLTKYCNTVSISKRNIK